MEEKVQTFLDYLRKGYSRRKSFQQSGLTFSEWNQIFTKDLENQVKEIESEYQHFLEDNRDKDASIIYSPILDNYQVVDFNNKQEIEDITNLITYIKSVKNNLKSNINNIYWKIIGLQKKYKDTFKIYYYRIGTRKN